MQNKPMLKVTRFYSSRIKLMLFIITSILMMTLYVSMTRSFSVTESVKTLNELLKSSNITDVQIDVPNDSEQGNSKLPELTADSSSSSNNDKARTPPVIQQQDLEKAESEKAMADDNDGEPNFYNNLEKNPSLLRNPLNNTALDNPERRNPHAAPVPIDDTQYNLMTDIYAPYEQIRVVKEKPGNPNRQNATLISLVRNSELFLMLGSIQQLENRFNKNYNYDWLFLNDEPFTDEFIELTSNMVSGTARYGIIPYEHWSYPDYIDAERAKDVRNSRKWASITYGSSESYRHMCRFNSMFFYKHPILDEYQYYWRVEPEVDFFCDITYDPFKYMVDNKKDYGFTISMREIAKTVESLWRVSTEYFLLPEVASHLPSNEESLNGFISDDDGKNYNLCHYWTNFEIANLDFYRSELYENYVQHLDKAGGFFYERWGDAPVHSIAVSQLMKKSQVHLFLDISYRHTVATSCPLDDFILKNSHCTCDPLLDYSITNGNSCNLKFLEVAGQQKLKDSDKYENKILGQKQKEEVERQERLAESRKLAQQRAEERKQRAEERRKKKEEAKEKAKKKKEKLKAMNGDGESPEST